MAQMTGKKGEGVTRSGGVQKSSLGGGVKERS